MKKNFPLSVYCILIPLLMVFLLPVPALCQPNSGAAFSYKLVAGSTVDNISFTDKYIIIREKMKDMQTYKITVLDEQTSKIIRSYTKNYSGDNVTWHELYNGKYSLIDVQKDGKINSYLLNALTGDETFYSSIGKYSLQQLNWCEGIILQGDITRIINIKLNIKYDIAKPINLTSTSRVVPFIENGLINYLDIENMKIISTPKIVAQGEYVAGYKINNWDSGVFLYNEDDILTPEQIAGLEKIVFKNNRLSIKNLNTKEKIVQQGIFILGCNSDNKTMFFVRDGKIKSYTVGNGFIDDWGLNYEFLPDAPVQDTSWLIAQRFWISTSENEVIIQDSSKICYIDLSRKNSSTVNLGGSMLNFFQVPNGKIFAYIPRIVQTQRNIRVGLMVFSNGKLENIHNDVTLDYTLYKNRYILSSSQLTIGMTDLRTDAMAVYDYVYGKTYYVSNVGNYYIIDGGNAVVVTPSLLSIGSPRLIDERDWQKSEAVGSWQTINGKILSCYKAGGKWYRTAYDYKTKKWDSALANAKLEKFDVIGKSIALSFDLRKQKMYFYTGNKLWSTPFPEKVFTSPKFTLSPDGKRYYYAISIKGNVYLKIATI